MLSCEVFTIIHSNTACMSLYASCSEKLRKAFINYKVYEAELSCFYIALSLLNFLHTLPKTHGGILMFSEFDNEVTTHSFVDNLNFKLDS